jgi:RNA polymerase sigma-70 factor (ECF subfamily)
MTIPAIPLGELEAQAPFLRRLARALVRDEDAAADLVQETWVAALRKGPREGEETRGWLARLLRNRARSGRRGAARRTERERAAGALRAGGGSGGDTQVAERVLAAVLALDEPSRAVILRRYYEDLSPSAIAARTHTPVKTVEARLARARAELRRRLDGDFGGRASWGAALIALSGLERPARLTSGALLLAAAGVCGVVAVGWRLRSVEVDGPAAAPAALVEAVAPPADHAVGLAEPARTPERAPERARAQAAAPEEPPEYPVDADRLERLVALIQGSVEGLSLIAPWVAVVPADGERPIRPLVAHACRPDGTFALEVPLEGFISGASDAYLVAVAQQRMPAWTRIRAVAGTTLELTLELLDAGAVAKGLVAEPSSAPVVHARVRFWRERGYESFAVGPYRLCADEGFPLATRDVVADAQGRFETFGFTPGRHRAAVLAPEMEGLTTMQLIDLDGGERVDLPHWTLALAPSLAVVEVQVVGPEGPLDAVSAAPVLKEPVLTGPRRRLTASLSALGYTGAEFLSTGEWTPLSPDGRLRIAYEPGSAPAIVFRRAGYQEATVVLGPARPGAEERLDVRLEPGGEPGVFVLKLEVPGELPSAFDVSFTPQAKGIDLALPLRRTVPVAGRLLQVTDVPPGEYKVELKAVGKSDVLPASTSLVLAPGEEQIASLRLVRGGALRLVAGEVPASPEGLELVLEPEGRVGFSGANGRGAAWGRTLDAERRLVCTPVDARPLAPGEVAELAPRVPAGAWRARLLSGDRLLWKGTLRIESGGVHDVPIPAR